MHCKCAAVISHVASDGIMARSQPLSYCLQNVQRRMASFCTLHVIVKRHLPSRGTQHIRHILKWPLTAAIMTYPPASPTLLSSFTETCCARPAVSVQESSVDILAFLTESAFAKVECPFHSIEVEFPDYNGIAQTTPQVIKSSVTI